MWHWAKNTGFDCESAREKVSSILDQIVDSRFKIAKKTQNTVVITNIALGKRSGR